MGPRRGKTESLTAVRAPDIVMALYPPGHFVCGQCCCRCHWLRIRTEPTSRASPATDNKYKTFQLGDILANLAGSSIGLYCAYHIEREYRARREIVSLYAPLDADPERGDEEYDVGAWDMSNTDHGPERSNNSWLDEPYGNTQPDQPRSKPLFQIDDDD